MPKLPRVKTAPAAVAERWDAMPAAERAALIRRSDKSMATERWSSLVDRMAERTFDGLTQLQREAVAQWLR